VPGKIVMDMDELMDAIRNEDYQKEKLEGFLKKNFKYLDGKSTDRTIDLIFPRS
jgi:CDP-ribitol ribitolphosphotransferase